MTSACRFCMWCGQFGKIDIGCKGALFSSLWQLPGCRGRYWWRGIECKRWGRGLNIKRSRRYICRERNGKINKSTLKTPHEISTCRFSLVSSNLVNQYTAGNKWVVQCLNLNSIELFVLIVNTHCVTQLLCTSLCSPDNNSAK